MQVISAVFRKSTWTTPGSNMV